MRFIELTSATDGTFLVKANDIDIVFYDNEVESVVAVINGVLTVIEEGLQEVRNILMPETK